MPILTSVFSAIRGREFPGGNPAKATALSTQTGWTSGSTRAGVTITDDTAVTVTAVYRAVQLIASSIAALPLHVYEEQPDGSRQKKNYSQDRYLWGRPNPEVSPVVFWETVIGHEVLNGNAFLFVVQNAAGEPLELWPVDPSRVDVRRDGQGRKFYVVDGHTEMTDFTQGGEMIHITGWGRDGLVGISPIKSMAAALGLAKAMEDYGSRLFSQGTVARGILTSDQPMNPAQAAEYSAAFDQYTTGAGNAHRTAVLGNGLKWQGLALNPEDAQMLATRQFQIAEVARMFGIPEHLIGSHDKQSSWGTGLEVNMRAFVTYTLQPHIIRFEQTISDELLRGQRYVKFELGGLLRGTALEQANVFQKYQQMGVYSVNNILTLLDMPTIDEGGDVRLVPLNIGRLTEDGPAPPPGDGVPAAVGE